MAKVILDIPTEKITSFLHLITKLGIYEHAISSQANANIPTATINQNLRKLTSKFLLFDWEFFYNELEFE
jgi:hypothetical protein